MSAIRVKNNEARLHSIPSSEGVIQLLPGLNMVPASAWDEVKKIKLVQFYLDSEVFEELGEVADTENPLKGMKLPQAVKAVEEIYDIQILKAVLNVEKRPRVAQAAKEQLALIEQAGDPPRR